MNTMKAMKPRFASTTGGAVMKLAAQTTSGAAEIAEVCSDYLAIQGGAKLLTPHPYASDQVKFENGSPSRISDIATALNHARFGSSFNRHFSAGAYPSTMIAAALSSGDLQKVISDAVRLIVMPSYNGLTEDILQWTKPVFVKDFREGVFSSVDVNDLASITEGGEVKHGMISANGQTFKLDTFGRNLLVTRHMLINNEFDVIAAGVQAFAVAAARKDAELQYNVLNDNNPLADGIPLFHASHNNLMPNPVSPFTASLGEAMAMLRQQPTVSGSYSNAKAAYMIVPAKLEADAYQAANQMLANNNGIIKVIASAYLSDNAWYVLADPKQYPTVGRVLLEDSKTPLSIEAASPRQLPLKYDGAGLSVRIDIQASALSHVGAVKVPTI